MAVLWRIEGNKLFCRRNISCKSFSSKNKSAKIMYKLLTIGVTYPKFLII